jgi:hypothetical protein
MVQGAEQRAWSREHSNGAQGEVPGAGRSTQSKRTQGEELMAQSFGELEPGAQIHTSLWFKFNLSYFKLVIKSTWFTSNPLLIVF